MEVRGLRSKAALKFEAAVATMKSEVSLFLFNKMRCNFEVAGIADGTLRNESI